MSAETPLISRQLSFKDEVAKPMSEAERNASGGIDTRGKFAGYFSPTWKIENLKPEYVTEDGKTIMAMADPKKCPTAEDKKRVEAEIYGLAESPEVVVKDARPLQKGDTSPEAAQKLFREKGFALMAQSSCVKDWSEDFITGMMTPWGNDISNVYAPEIEEIIRNILLVDYDVIHVDAKGGVIKRGPGSRNNFYGTGVHQDYGLTVDDYIDNLAPFDPYGGEKKKFDEHFNKPECTGFMIINFWRPVCISGPLYDKPLAVCDPDSVRKEDHVWTGLDSASIGGTGAISNQMALKHNPAHKWYYYSQQTCDEVLIFKQFEHWKGEENTGRGPKHWANVPSRGNFHTAFVDPHTPEGTPPRTSTEYRVPVWIGKKRTPEEVANYQPLTVARRGTARECFAGCSVS